MVFFLLRILKEKENHIPSPNNESVEVEDAGVSSCSSDLLRAFETLDSELSLSQLLHREERGQTASRAMSLQVSTVKELESHLSLLGKLAVRGVQGDIVSFLSLGLMTGRVVETGMKH